MGSARHILRSASTGTAVVTAAIEALLAQVKRATASEMDEIVVGVLALAAKVMGLSAEELSEMNRTSVSGPLESFTTISRFIEANLVSRDLSVAKISSTFGLSRATLYRLFEPVGGVACYIRSRRLVRARNDPDRTDCLAGFQSIAAFNRAFS
jgi:AraC-like DNA-binding protein